MTEMTPKIGVNQNIVGKRAVRRNLLTEEIAADIVNGVAKSDILTKLENNIYQYQERGFSTVQSYRWYNDGVKRLQQDSDDRMEVKRDILWSRYQQIYQDALESGQLGVAKATLDSIAKVFGLQAPEQKEITLKEAEIKFGFNGD